MHLQSLESFDYTNVIYGLAVSSDPDRIRYVGQTMDLKSRIKSHRQYAKRPSTPVHYWMASHPSATIIVYLLEQLDSSADLDDAEVKWIAELDTFIKDSQSGGLNCDRGGKGKNSSGYRHSTESKESISLALRGEDAPTAILSEADVIKIRDLYFSYQVRAAELAEMFGVSKSAIQGIIKRRKWKHLPASEAELSYTKRRSTKAVLTDEQVLDIRRRLDNNEPVSSIAREYQVSRGTIYFIRDRVTYADV